MFTWQISFEYIRDNSPTAARLLSITSLFNRQGIPISLLEAYYQDNDDTDADFEVDLDTLLNFSLVSVEVDGCHLQMHRLVQFLITRWFDLHGELDCWKQTYVTVLRDNHPRAKVAKREEYQRILPHVEAAITYQPKNEDALDSWATLLELSASYGSCISHHKKAEELARYALATRETTLGNMDPQTLDTSHRLVVILSNSRKFEDAELLARKVLQARQEILGAEHKDTLKSRITLAVILTGLGGWEEAKMIFCEALEVLRKIGEPVHSSISWIMSKFLHAIAHQGRYGEAELIQREVLRKFDTAAGTTEVKEHLMMSTMVNLGRTLQEQKKFEEAKTWFIQALKYCKEQYGAKHINYLAIVFDYADNLGSMGEYKEAEPLFREALADMESIFTEDNLDILMCRQMLGTALRMQHKNQEAEDIFRRTLAGNVRLLGEEHRYTLASMHALAMVLSELGSYEEAEGLYRRTLAGRLRLLGEEDRRTIDAIYWLATFLENSARYKEADELFRRALTGYLKIYGEESSDTLFSMYNLANTQWMLGRSGEAIALMTQCFQVQKKVLGYDHEYTRLSLAYLKGMRDEEFKDADMDEVTEQLETLTTESEVTGEAGVSN
jgi:tetratricopeptide (TPR) repeat protein